MRSAPLGRKWTSLFCSVRPATTGGSFLLGPSTSTSSTRPMRAWVASADRSTTIRSRSNRSLHTAGSTNWSVRAAASVPGRGEKMNV